MTAMLPAKGPWPHPYYELPDAFPWSSELEWMDDASHFLQVDAPERTVEHILAFDRDEARKV